MNFPPYVKTIVAALGAVALVVADVLSDNTVTVAEWVQIAIAVVTVIGVRQLPNAALPPKRERVRLHD